MQLSQNLTPERASLNCIAFSLTLFLKSSIDETMRKSQVSLLGLQFGYSFGCILVVVEVLVLKLVTFRDPNKEVTYIRYTVYIYDI